MVLVDAERESPHSQAVCRALDTANSRTALPDSARFGSGPEPADMHTLLHIESSLGRGGQEIRTLAETRWLISHGWNALIACTARQSPSP